MDAELPMKRQHTHPQRSPARTARYSVLDVPVSVLTMEAAIRQVNSWVTTTEHRPRLVTFVNAHMAVEARLRPKFRETLRKMDLNCADGAPIFWLARRRHGRRIAKISGPEFMPLFCEQSASLGHRHFLYGGPEGVAEETAAALQKRYPGIQIAGHHCPPYRRLTDAETDEVISKINGSRPDVVWVCLGCPKQEQWMSEMSDRLDVKVLLAVGQAFDIIAGRRQRAPELLRNLGGEWAFRLAMEPRRLWKRYLVTNLLFVLFVLRGKLDRERRGEEALTEILPAPTFGQSRSGVLAETLRETRELAEV